jgi:predicted dehydrogenase
MTIRIGILGFAHGHVNSYCRRWLADPSLGATPVAGWDRFPERTAKAAEHHGLEACDSADALLGRDDVDAVVIGAETVFHADLAVAAAEAGKPTALQKPMALTLEDADRIVEAVERTGVPFTMAWQMRVDPENLEIKRLVDEGALGRLMMVRRRHGLSTHMMELAGSWHVDPELNRDIWADDAAHAVDFLLWLLGMPESVTAEIGSFLDPRIPNDNGIAIFRYPGGPIAEVVSSFTCVAGENTTEIVGEKGTLVQNFGDGPSSNIPRPPGAISLKWFLRDNDAWTVSGIEPLARQGDRIANLAGPLAAFFRGDRLALATAREGRDALRLILATCESSEQGRRVTLA